MEEIYLVIIDATNCQVIYHNFSVLKRADQNYDDEIEDTIDLITDIGDAVEWMARIGEPFTIKQM